MPKNKTKQNKTIGQFLMTTAPKAYELHTAWRHTHEIVFWQSKNFGP